MRDRGRDGRASGERLFREWPLGAAVWAVAAWATAVLALAMLVLALPSDARAAVGHPYL